MYVFCEESVVFYFYYLFSSLPNSFGNLTSNVSLHQDILENEDVKLDHMFIGSLVADIVKVKYFFQILFSVVTRLAELATVDSQGQV